MPSSAFLVGLGSVAVKYDLRDKNSMGLTHARSIDNHVDFTLVGGYDPSEDNRFEFFNEYGKQAFDDLENGLRVSKPDVVVVASPTANHLENIKQILTWSTPKIILCEKPLSLVPKDANDIIQICNSRNIPLFVNYFRNSEPSTFAIAEAISLQHFVEPFMGSCTYNKGALHTATHFLNLFQIWFGEPKDFKYVGEKKNSFNTNDPNIEFEVHYNGGIIKFCSEDSSNKLLFHSSIEFRNGTLEYANEGEEISWIKSDYHQKAKNRDLQATDKIKSFAGQAQFNVWNELSNFIKGENYRLCTAQNALRYIIQISNLKRN